MKLYYYIRNNNLFRQAVRYIITGGVAFCIDFVVYWIFTLFVHYQIATLAGLIAGLLVNYLFSKFWVFKNDAPVSKRETILFIIFTAFGFVLTALGMYVGVDILNVNDKIVKFVVALIVFVMNFIVRKYIVFAA